jgi:hypothetical protein
MRPIIDSPEVAVTKAFTCISLIILAITLQPAFAQTGGVIAPSPLHSAPVAKPAPSTDPTEAVPKAKHGHRGRKPGASSTGTSGSQFN